MKLLRVRHLYPWLLPLGVVVGALAACFWPLIRHPGCLLVGTPGYGANDLSDLFVPHLMVPRLTLRRFGQWPFWCPWWGSGTPFLGNPQSSVFYPLSWPFWMLDPVRTISWSLVVHHLIAALGAYALSRRLGCAQPGALFASVAFSVSPILLARTGAGHLPCLASVSWYPWVFWNYAGFRAGRPRSALGLVLTAALAGLAGHVQEAFYLVLTLTVLCLVEAGHSLITGARTRALGQVLRFALVGVATAGLMSAELIPVAVYLGQSDRAARLRSGFVGEPGLANLLQLLHPFALGRATSYTGPGSFYWETICHFGLVALGLAVLGTAVLFRERRTNRWLAALGMGLFLLPFGQDVPWIGLVAAHIPGLAQFRCQGRLFHLTALFVAVLAGFGVDWVANAGREPGITSRKTARLAGALLALVLGMATAFGIIGLLAVDHPATRRRQPQIDGRSLQEYAATWLAAGAALGCTVLAGAFPRRATLFAGLLIPLGAIESASFASSVLRTRSEGSFPRRNPVVDLLSQRAAGWRVFGAQSTLSDLEALDAGLFKVQEYESVPLWKPFLYFVVTLNPRDPFEQLLGYVPADMTEVSLPLLDLWSARYIVLADGDRPPRQRTDWKKIADLDVPLRGDPALTGPIRRRCHVWENPQALPRGFVVGRVRTIRPQADAVTIFRALHALDPRNELLLERDELPAGPRQEYTPATRVEDTPNRIVLEVETQHPGYLVLADNWYPGWSAAVDGRPTPVHLADIAFRAVALPDPGRHRVTFSYYPKGLNAGLAISAVTALVLSGFLLCPPTWPGARKRDVPKAPG